MKLRQATSRSRHGCSTCKLRRVKCDETLPSCKRCLDTGRICDGPSPGGIIIRLYQNQQRTLPELRVAPALPLSEAFLDSTEARAFDFYLQCAAPALGGVLDREFWQVLLPRLCHQDATIKHAVLAISTLYENPLFDAYHPPPVGIVYTGEQRRALRWYARSVSGVITGSQADDELRQIETALLTCLLFTSVEVQQVNVVNTVTLLERGFRLVARYFELCRPSPSGSPSWVSKLVIPALVRQTILFGIFGHPLSPDAFRILQSVIPSGPMPFESTQDIRDSIYAILVRGFDFVQRASIAGPGQREALPQLESEQAHLLEWLKAWLNESQTFIESSQVSDRDRVVVDTLRCYERVIYLWISRAFHGRMFEDADEMQSYHSILHHSEQALDRISGIYDSPSNMPFTLELGFMPALFFVGWQCRDTEVCRRAVALMRRSPAQENLLVTMLQVNLIEKLIAIKQAFAALDHNVDGTTLSNVTPPSQGHQRMRTIDSIIDRSLRLPRSGTIIEDGGYYQAAMASPKHDVEDYVILGT